MLDRYREQARSHRGLPLTSDFLHKDLPDGPPRRNGNLRLCRGNRLVFRRRPAPEHRPARRVESHRATRIAAGGTPAAALDPGPDTHRGRAGLFRTRQARHRRSRRGRQRRARCRQRADRQPAHLRGRSPSVGCTSFRTWGLSLSKTRN